MLDLRTICFSSATILIGFSATLLVLFLSDRQRRELLSFTVALGLIAAGNILVPLRGIIPDFISVVIANSALFAGTLAVWRGCRRLMGIAPSPRSEVSTFALLFCALMYFLYVDPSVNARIIAMSGFILAITVRSLLDLIRLEHPRRSPAGRLIMGCLAASAAMLLLRIVITLIQPPIADYMHPGTMQVAVLVAPIAIYIALALGIFWMTFERIADQLRQRNVALEAAQRVAQQASSAKSAFLANISHEIRTPMNGIIGCTDILLEMSPTTEQKPYLLMLRNAERLLLTIINDILDFSKLDSAGFTLDMAPVELVSVVQGSVDLIRAQAAEKDLSLTAAIDPALPVWMLGDATRLRQILLNLLSNAVKFTPAGSVALSVKPHRTGETKQIRFEVRDTGIGVAAERQHLLFQDFSQVHDHNRFGGTGLGLAICKRLVTAMGGSIGMESKEDQGSLFWFVLPLMAPDLPDAGLTERAETPEMPGARILVAEDVKVNQVIVERMLTRAGHKVTLVDDGAAALAAIQAAAYDLILMDMRMPVMDGVEATEAIRRLDGPAGTIPIIGLTANATPEDAARCRAAGMDDLLIKPVDRATLLGTLARWRAGRAA